MRSLIVKIIATMSSFYLAQYLVAGFKIDNTWQAYLLAAIVFILFNLLVAPVIKLLLLPINLLTLGLFHWLTQVLVLYIFDLLYTGLSIAPYYYPGYTSAVVALPAGNLGLFWVLLITSLLMSLTYGLVTGLFQGRE